MFFTIFWPFRDQTINGEIIFTVSHLFCFGLHRLLWETPAPLAAKFLTVFTRCSFTWCFCAEQVLCCQQRCFKCRWQMTVMTLNRTLWVAGKPTGWLKSGIELQIRVLIVSGEVIWSSVNMRNIASWSLVWVAWGWYPNNQVIMWNE